MASDGRADVALDMRVALLVMGQAPEADLIPPYSQDLNAAWRVARRIKDLPYRGWGEKRHSLEVALRFDEMMRQAPLLDLLPEQAAQIICETALVAMEEETDAEQTA